MNQRPPIVRASRGLRIFVALVLWAIVILPPLLGGLAIAVTIYLSDGAPWLYIFPAVIAVGFWIKLYEIFLS